MSAILTISLAKSRAAFNSNRVRKDHVSANHWAYACTISNISGRICGPYIRISFNEKASWVRDLETDDALKTTGNFVVKKKI